MLFILSCLVCFVKALSTNKAASVFFFPSFAIVNLSLFFFSLEDAAVSWVKLLTAEGSTCNCQNHILSIQINILLSMSSEI